MLWRLWNIPRLPVEGSPAAVGLAYEDVAFYSRNDGILLKGWFIRGEGNIALIVVHGGYENRVDYIVSTLDLTRDLVEKEYSVLLFDLRGRGESAGKGCSLSNIEYDIGGAKDYVESLGYTASDKTCIIGYCSGAASSCIFASQENVGALVLDGCFPSVQAMVGRQATKKNIPLFLLNFFWPGVLQASQTIYGFRLVNPIDVVPKIKCPILFIHEEYDEVVSLEDNYRMFQASGNPAGEVWQVQDAEHSEGYTRNPDDYIEKIDAFLNNRLGFPHGEQD